MRIIAAVIVASLVSVGTVREAAAGDEVVSIDVASIFAVDIPILGTAGHELAARVRRATGGRVAMVFHAPGELVPVDETVDAVTDGRIKAAWSSAGWFSDRDSAFNFFATVPFGPTMGEYMAWMYYGGGLGLSRELFARQGIHNIPCGMIPPEASGWFREEIRTVDDLVGLRMRIFGLGAAVMRKLGVETEQVPPGEILDRLLDGSLDATEFSMPVMDELMGFQKVANYYYFPGWHQQATLFDLHIGTAVWDGLDDETRAVIELACGDVMRDMIAKSEAIQAVALAALQTQGVQFRRWPPGILVAMEDAWGEVVVEESARSADFARVHRSYADFRKGYGLWRVLSHLH